MSPIWLMDYGSDAGYVIQQYGLIHIDSLCGNRHTFPIKMPLIIFIFQKKKKKSENY